MDWALFAYGVGVLVGLVVGYAFGRLGREDSKYWRMVP